MTATPGLGAWLRHQREHRTWPRIEMARRLIKAAQASGDTAMPAAEDVAASIYRWERGTISPSDRYRLYYCHVLGIPPDRFGDPGYDPAQDPPRVIITISLPEGTDTRIKLTSTDTQPAPGTPAQARRAARPALRFIAAAPAPANDSLLTAPVRHARAAANPGRIITVRVLADARCIWRLETVPTIMERVGWRRRQTGSGGRVRGGSWIRGGAGWGLGQR